MNKRNITAEKSLVEDQEETEIPVEKDFFFFPYSVEGPCVFIGFKKLLVDPQNRIPDLHY